MVGHFEQVSEIVSQSFRFSISARQNGQRRYAQLLYVRWLATVFKTANFQFSVISVTEREVINGILSVKNTKNHCLAYIRMINNINLQNLKKASLFVDIINRSLDMESAKLLADLRDVRLPNKIETTNFQK